MMMMNDSVNEENFANLSDFEKFLYQVRHGNIQAVEDYIAGGGDLETTGGKLRGTILHQASESGHHDIVKLLIDNGADIFSLDKHDNSALETAAREGHAEVVKIFVSKMKKEELNITKDKYHQTALYKAAAKGHFEVAKILIEAGADETIVTNNNKTPLQIAFETRKNHHLMNFLLSLYMERGSRAENRGAFDFALELESGFDFMKKGSNDDYILDLCWRNDTFDYLSFLLDCVKKTNIFTRGSALDRYLGRDHEMFHLRRVHINDEERKSFLEFINEKDKKMIKERQLFLDLLNQIDVFRGGDESSRDHRINHQLKVGLPTSPWLAETLDDMKQRISWGPLKYKTMLFICFFRNIILGWFSYGFDIYTDGYFIDDMLFKHSNLSQTTEDDIFAKCRPELKPNIEEVVKHCLDTMNMECLVSLRQATRQGENCLEVGRRFDNADAQQWWITGIISLAHCIAPLVILLFVWIFFMIRRKQFSFCLLPIPIITKTQRFVIERKIFQNNRHKLNDQFEARNTELEEELEINLSLVNVSVVIEAALESCFQFWIQTIYVVPTLYLSFMDVTSEGYGWADLFNLKIFSIVTSFATFSWTFCSIRNRSKGEALGLLHKTILILKTVFDAMSRVLIFSIWMYVYNKGKFSSLITLAGFYILFGVILIFNFIFNRSKNYSSPSYWIGLILNSFSCVLSFNSLYIETSLNKVKKKHSQTPEEYWHQSSFIKQFIYNSIIFCFKLGLTIHTALIMTKGDIKLTDLQGIKHDLPWQNVVYILTSGWISFIISILFNLLYYKLHPMEVEISLNNKMKTSVLGKERGGKRKLQEDVEEPLLEAKENQDFKDKNETSAETIEMNQINERKNKNEIKGKNNINFDDDLVKVEELFPDEDLDTQPDDPESASQGKENVESEQEILEVKDEPDSKDLESVELGCQQEGCSFKTQALPEIQANIILNKHTKRTHGDIKLQTEDDNNNSNEDRIPTVNDNQSSEVKKQCSAGGCSFKTQSLPENQASIILNKHVQRHHSDRRSQLTSGHHQETQDVVDRQLSCDHCSFKTQALPQHQAQRILALHLSRSH